MDQGTNATAIYYFPYLNLETPVRFGPWELFTTKHQGSTLTAVQMKRVEQVRKLSLGSEHRSLYSGTFVSRLSPELETAEEQDLERGALAQAVQFASVASNAQTGFQINRGVLGSDLYTAENTQLLIFPLTTIDQGKGYLSDFRPLVRIDRVVDIGVDHYTPPQGLVSSRAITLDTALLEAVFSIMMTASKDGAPDEVLQLRNAIHWYLRAWSNNPETTEEDLVVFQKTALEALGGSSTSASALSALERIYSSVVGTISERDFLYTPKQEFQRTYKGKTTDITDFAQWYWCLAETRNQIIHDTLGPDDWHIQIEGSQFNGILWEVAERVIRELIVIRLAQFGFDQCALTDVRRRELAFTRSRPRLKVPKLIEPSLHDLLQPA